MRHWTFDQLLIQLGGRVTVRGQISLLRPCLGVVRNVHVQDKSNKIPKFSLINPTPPHPYLPIG